MCAQEAKRNRIIDLSDAYTRQKKIAKIVDVSERTVRRIQHVRKFGRGTKRSPGSGGHHRTRKQGLPRDSQGQNHEGSYSQHEKTC